MTPHDFALQIVLQKQASPSSSDIVNMQDGMGMAADYLTPGSFGGTRAGRSAAMARASGQAVPFSVEHPTSSTLLGALGGGLVGGVGGAAASRLLDPAGPEYAPAILGALGAAGGGVLGGLGAGALRRRHMQNIGSKYDEANAAGKAAPKKLEFNTLATILAPDRASHRQGQLEATREMLGDEKSRTGGRLRNAAPGVLRSANIVAPGVGSVLALLARAGHNVETHVNANKLNKRIEE